MTLARVALLSSILGAATFAALATATAEAQQADHRTRFDTPAYGTEWSVNPQYVPSSESFTLELRVGAYQPDIGPAFNTAFNGDLGPMIGLEMDGHIVRVPFIGPIIFGVSFGWVEWSGGATAMGGAPVGANVGNTGLSLVQFAGLAGWRIDGLARHLSVPLILTPKVGIDAGYWQTGITGRQQADGWTVGFHWAMQLALELDFLDPRAAHRLDNAWGINHSEILFEIFGADLGPFSGHMLPLGAAIAWTAGLGFTF